ncbi:hypothetical protein A7X81_01480 [Campylobacter ornithocola]|uniref:Uncharacterized protein n=1 Tax=Campylobacter ornithocola TaxID=1848766 RepID=A0A6M8MYL0_9BACT|nr:hypothetical protein [Campylobacter ornithocola]OCX43085.1 hypothetical protein A7X81_01480 [Campylobacter ornithocola]QKF57457.1 hypothetical protein CORN_0941 [Campylobacter ornithocola]
MRYKKPNTKKHEHFLQTRKEPNALYLGVNTNIKCFNNICPSEKHYWYFFNHIDLENKINITYNPKFGVYLGKITFDKKGNKLIPEYISTSIENLEEEVKKIKNPLWIAEKNDDYVKPEPFFFEDNIFGKKVKITRDNYRLTNPNNLEYQCKIEKNTIILNQEQIISYVKEIHSKNVKIIQEYIEQIYKDNGIKPYAFDDEFYEELGDLGIITQRQVEGFKSDRLIKKNSLLLTMLDYLARQDRKSKDYLITFDDEYFYDYFVFSLGGFMLKLSQGMLQNEINSLFNPAVYIDDTKVNYKDLSENLNKHYEKELLNMGFEKKGSYFVDYFDYSFNYKGFFEINLDDYFPNNLHSKTMVKLKYNNEINFGIKYKYNFVETPNILYTKKNNQMEEFYIPSTLGKYYFQISRYHNEVFFELLKPYYPDIKNLPKGWCKEMIEKSNNL